MKRKKRRPELIPKPCRVCGGTSFTYTEPVHTRTLSFVHVRAKCDQCGTWCGGFTLMNEENGHKGDIYVT